MGAAATKPHRPNIHAQDVRAISTHMRRDIVRSEGSVILLFGAALIVAFDATSMLGGTTFPGLYIALDALQCSVLVGLGLALRSSRLPDPWTPWLFAAALTVNTAVSNYGASVVGEGSLASILVMLVLLGAVVGFWAPFAVAAVLCFVMTSVAVQFTVPGEALTWGFATITALAFSAVVLRGRMRTVDTAAQAQRSISLLANRDPLTGLLNRRGLAESWRVLHARAVRTETSLFAVFIDVADLKSVNDRDGHEAGDVLLQEVADTLQRQSRGDELVARWDGDEFVIIGLGNSPDAMNIGMRILTHIDRDRIYGLWQPRLWIGVEQGSESVSLDVIVGNADARSDLCSLRPGDSATRRD